MSGIEVAESSSKSARVRLVLVTGGCAGGGGDVVWLCLRRLIGYVCERYEDGVCGADVRDLTIGLGELEYAVVGSG